MRRFFAIMAFLAGGISVEIAKPLNCTLMESSQRRLKRHKIRCINGE